MEVKHLSLARFTVFEELNIDFSPGINVFLGANSTGKSHLMKLIYSLLRVWWEGREDFGTRRQRVARLAAGLEDSGAQSKSVLARELSERIKSKLAGVFRPDDRNVGRLVRKSHGRNSAEMDLGVGKTKTVKLHAKLSSLGKVSASLGSLIDNPPTTIFLPAREVLSMYEGFVSAYINRELSFDETYYDLCLALGANPLKGPRGATAAALFQPLSDHLHAAVRRDGERFYIEIPGEGSIEAHLVAEGFRKLASVMHLISNGSLMQNGILFWDEPEANLNPRLIKTVADFLLTLAGSGIQIFIATHDYLLTNELSLHAEYQTEAAKRANIRFFGLHREPNGPTQIQSGAVLADLEHNPIMEEFAALYTRERNLFYEGNAVENPGA